jgi:hypothetical protein
MISLCELWIIFYIGFHIRIKFSVCASFADAAAVGWCYYTVSC